MTHFKCTVDGMVPLTEEEEAEYLAELAAGQLPQPPVVPKKVHKVHIITVLTNMDLINAVENRIEEERQNGNPTYHRYWQAVSDVYRSDPLIAAFALLFSWTSEQIDTMFIEAAAIAASIEAAQGI